MKPQLIKLGDRLRSLRRKAHKSQYELADEWRALGLPITRDMIANWETNRAQIPARFIPLIAFSLNAGVADLSGHSGCNCRSTALGPTESPAYHPQTPAWSETRQLGLSAQPWSTSPI